MHYHLLLSDRQMVSSCWERREIRKQFNVSFWRAWANDIFYHLIWMTCRLTQKKEPHFHAAARTSSVCLTDELAEVQSPATLRSHSSSALLHVCAVLRCYASGSFFLYCYALRWIFPVKCPCNCKRGQTFSATVSRAELFGGEESWSLFLSLKKFVLLNRLF